MYADMLDVQHRLDRHLIGAIAVTDDGTWPAHILDDMEQREGLRAVPVWREVKAEDKAGLAVNDEPEVVLDTQSHQRAFIGVKVEHRNELKGEILEQGRKTCTPVVDGGVGDLDVHGGTLDQSDIPEGIVAQVDILSAIRMTWTGYRIRLKSALPKSLDIEGAETAVGLDTNMA